MPSKMNNRLEPICSDCLQTLTKYDRLRDGMGTFDRTVVSAAFHVAQLRPCLQSDDHNIYSHLRNLIWQVILCPLCIFSLYHSQLWTKTDWSTNDLGSLLTVCKYSTHIP